MIELSYFNLFLVCAVFFAVGWVIREVKND